VIQSWNKDALDKSKAFLVPHADEIIETILKELKAESVSPPKQCCGKKRLKETIDLYSFVSNRKRATRVAIGKKSNE